MWGEYKVLVDREATEHDMLVEGKAYWVQDEEQLGKLAAWEGKNYKVQRCAI